MKTDLKAACDRIVYNGLLVGKKSRRIFDWVKLNTTNEVYNPIQYFFEFKRAPPVIHEIHDYSYAYGFTLKDRVDELPVNWKDFSTAVSNFNSNSTAISYHYKPLLTSHLLLFSKIKFS